MHEDTRKSWGRICLLLTKFTLVIGWICRGRQLLNVVLTCVLPYNQTIVIFIIIINILMCVRLLRVYVLWATSISTGCTLPFMYTFSIKVRQPYCEDICMIYYAVFKRTKSTHCLRLILPSGLSSSAKGMKCNEMPCFLSVTLEQPPNTDLFGIFSILWLFSTVWFFII